MIIATDDIRIAAVAKGFGAAVAMTSTKHESGTDRCAEVARGLRSFSHVINVQGDEPLIDPALISRIAKTMAAEPNLSMVTAATPFAPNEDVANPNAVKVVLDRAKNALYFSRSPIPFVRGSTHPTFLRHLGIYGYTTKFLLQFVRWKPSPLERLEALEQLRALENGTRIRVLSTRSASIGVDVPGDILLAEALLNSL